MKTIKIPFTNKVIVDKDKYEQGQLAATTRDGMIDTITALQNGKVEFAVSFFPDNYIVLAKHYAFNIIIKAFPFGDDREYARLCAEELCEMLNSKM